MGSRRGNYLPPLEQWVQAFLEAELQAVKLTATKAMAMSAMMDFILDGWLFFGLRPVGITRSELRPPVLVDKVLPLGKHGLESLHFLSGEGNRG